MMKSIFFLPPSFAPLGSRHFLRLLVIFFAAVGCGVGCGARDLIVADSIETESLNGCSIERFECESPTMQRKIRGWVVLPPAYAMRPEATFPVLYALHGHSAPYDTYARMSRLREALADMPMIVAGFDGDAGSWYQDSPIQRDSQFTTFFFEEFLPSLEAHWRSNGERAVTGFSMGGFGAMHFVLTHPEMFTSVSGFSTAIDPLDGLPERLRLELPGLMGEDFMAEDSPLRLNHRLSRRLRSGGTIPPVYQHCGTEDRLLVRNRQFVDLLATLNAERAAADPESPLAVDFRYVETPGNHDWAFWHGQIVGVLQFHFQHFSKGS